MYPSKYTEHQEVEHQQEDISKYTKDNLSKIDEILSILNKKYNKSIAQLNKESSPITSDKLNKSNITLLNSFFSRLKTEISNTKIEPAILKDKVLKPITLNLNSTKTFKVCSKYKVYPAKIRIFSHDPDLMCEIYVNFNPIDLPIKKEDKNYITSDIKSVGKFLVIDKKWKYADERSEIYITIVA